MLDGSVSSSCALLSHMPHATLDDYLFFPLKMIVITFLPPHLDDDDCESRDASNAREDIAREAQMLTRRNERKKIDKVQ